MTEKRSTACNLSAASSVGEGEALVADPSASVAGRSPRDPNRTTRIESPAVLEQRILDVAPRIRALARRLCRNSHDAEEVAQDALARALRYRDAFDPDAGTLENWMMKTAFRSYLDHRARDEKSPRAMGDAVESVRAHEVHTVELRDEIESLLATLTETERRVLLRFHRDRQTIREIGRDLEMPEGTVKSHLHRARLRLLQRGKEQ